MPTEKTSSESRVQQNVRLKIAQQGGLVWRNNVGATPHCCPKCGHESQPVRYGLANDSAKLNEHIKSSDLIGIVPRRVLQVDVGRVIGQFVSVEVKPEGWQYAGTEHEEAQRRWLQLVLDKGGLAGFSTGRLPW